MQHVKKSWLTFYALLLFVLDIVIIIGYVCFNFTSLGADDFSHWGLTNLSVGISLIHFLYIAIVFRYVRKRSEWLATLISQVIFLFLFATLIETSHYDNLTIRIGYALMVFSAALTGPFVPIASIVITWILLLYTYFNLTSALVSNIYMRFEIFIDIAVTVSGLLGWLVFKRFYIKTKDKETIALSKLLEQEQFKSNVMLESISDGVMVINTRGTVQVLNKSAATMLGWSKHEALRLAYRSLLKPLPNSEQKGKNQDAANVIEQTLASCKTNQAVVLLKTKNQRQLFVDIVASPIMETLESKNSESVPSEKQLVGVIAVLRDVDEKQRQEQQRSDFISTASHEMRTPVASIQGYLDLIITPKIWQDTEKVKQYIQKARISTQHLGELFEDLLSISQSDDGRLVSTPEQINVDKLIGDVLEPELPKARNKGLKVITKSNDAPQVITPMAYVYADPARLSEVILNLFDNALKYTKTGSITVSTNTDNDRVYISVSDTGIGIAEEDIPHMFQKFYRTDNSATREIGGTGLGLYLCKQLVEVMGGKINLQSQLGKGSTFTVELPRSSI